MNPSTPGFCEALLNSAMEMFAVVGKDMTLKYHSPTAARLLGFGDEEVLGRDALGLVHPDDRAEVGELLDRARSTPEAVPVRGKFRLATRDGDWLWVDASFTDLTRTPAVRGVIVNGHDITREVELRRSLEKSRKQEWVARLAGGVAHRFNNHMTVISGYADLLASEPALTDEQRVYVREIERSAERAAHLTQQLLAVGQGQFLCVEDVSLNEVVADTRSLIHALTPPAVVVRIELDESNPIVRADVVRLRQVILELCANAADATAGAGGVIVVRTGSRATDPAHRGMVSLTVSDNGIGMHHDVLEKIFEPFFTTKPRGHGNGLGLSTAYGIVLQLGGSLEVRSTPGAGSMFRIWLQST